MPEIVTAALATYMCIFFHTIVRGFVSTESFKLPAEAPLEQDFFCTLVCARWRRKSGRKGRRRGGGAGFSCMYWRVKIGVGGREATYVRSWEGARKHRMLCVESTGGTFFVFLTDILKQFCARKLLVLDWERKHDGPLRLAAQTVSAGMTVRLSSTYEGSRNI